MGGEGGWMLACLKGENPLLELLATILGFVKNPSRPRLIVGSNKHPFNKHHMRHPAELLHVLPQLPQLLLGALRSFVAPSGNLRGYFECEIAGGSKRKKSKVLRLRSCFLLVFLIYQ